VKKKKRGGGSFHDETVPRKAEKPTKTRKARKRLSARHQGYGRSKTEEVGRGDLNLAAKKAKLTGQVLRMGESTERTSKGKKRETEPKLARTCGGEDKKDDLEAKGGGAKGGGDYGKEGGGENAEGRFRMALRGNSVRHFRAKHWTPYTAIKPQEEMGIAW